MKKKLLMAVSYVLILALGVMGTVAYFTDRDAEVNVFTVGDVAIELNDDFDQGAELMPGKNIDNVPTITNTGKSDAWVWLTFSIPSALDNLVQGTEQGSNENVIHWNPLGATTDGYVTDTRVDNAITAGYLPEGITAEKILEEKMTWNVFNSLGEGTNVFEETINGVDYNTYVLLYNKALAPNETTLPNIYKVFLDAQIDATPEGDWYRVVNGTASPIEWNVKEDGCPIIYLNAYGIQKDMFADVKAAYDGYVGQWGGLNGNDVIVAEEVGITDAGTYDLTEDVYTIDSAYFHTQKVTDDVTINGNGAVVEGIATSADAFQWEGGTIPAMSPIFSSADGSKVTVNDLTFSGTMSAILLGHYKNSTYKNYNTELNNVDVIGTEVVSFSSGISPAVCAYGTAVLNNCNIYGTTLSELDTDPMWPVYDLVAVNYTDVTVNNSKIGSIYMWNQAKVTVADGSEVDTIVVRGNMNTTMYGLTVKAGATVDAIDLSNITNKAKINITIEDGATVGGFVDNGVTYATLADWQAAQ